MLDPRWKMASQKLLVKDRVLGKVMLVNKSQLITVKRRTKIRMMAKRSLWMI